MQIQSMAWVPKWRNIFLFKNHDDPERRRSAFDPVEENGDSSELSKLPTDNLTVAVTGQEKPIDDLAVDVEIPLLVVRVFNTDGATHTVEINAFIEPDSSDALKNCIYADAITGKFI